MITENIYNELIKFKDNPVVNPSGADDTIQYLISQNLIEETPTMAIYRYNLIHVEWVITPAGLSALSEFEQEANKESERKRQQRFCNAISVLAFLISVISLIVAIIK